MTGAEVFAAVMVAILGGGGVGAVAVKMLSRPVDTATAEKTHAEARLTDITASSAEVETIRGVLKDVRDAQTAQVTEHAAHVAEIRTEHAAQLAEFRTEMAGLKGRVSTLEERERHMLIRAAVHEAWDQMAFAALVAQNPQHPPPPPLTIAGESSADDPAGDDSDTFSR